MDKRYQVFLSSTYEDLKEERMEVMKAILELDCFPVGMEYFPASNDDQWTFISALIDQCDYYILILGARYGSLDPTGIGYTQKEYEYAISKGIPVIAFVHADPGSVLQKNAEQTDEGRKKFSAFRDLVRKKLCKEWSTVDGLGAVVSRSLTQLIKSTPRTGWVRADQLSTQESYKEILKLKETVESQKKELDDLRLMEPKGAEQFAQGLDKHSISCRITRRDKQYPYKSSERITFSLEKTWDEIFVSFAPYLRVPSTEKEIQKYLNRLVTENSNYLLEGFHDFELISPLVPPIIVQQIIAQFTALGMIKVAEIDGEGNKGLFYHLSELGKQYLTMKMAIKRS